MTEVAPASTVVLRAPRSLVLLGWAAVVAGACFVVAGPFDGELGMSLFGVGVVVLGVTPLRMRVEAGSTGLILNGGFRTQRYAWADIESFRVLAQRWSGRGPGLFVLLRNGTMVQVPLPYGGGAVRSSRVVANLERVRAELERVRSSDA